MRAVTTGADHESCKTSSTASFVCVSLFWALFFGSEAKSQRRCKCIRLLVPALAIVKGAPPRAAGYFVLRRKTLFSSAAGKSFIYADTDRQVRQTPIHMALQLP